MTAKIVNGFIKNIQQQLSRKHHTLCIIPKEINRLCTSFLCTMTFAFYKQHTGQNLEFIGDNIVTKTKSHPSYSMVAIGECISRQICDTFRIEYLLRNDNQGLHNLLIGFFRFDYFDDLELLDWEESPYSQRSSEAKRRICCINIRCSTRNKQPTLFHNTLLRFGEELKVKSAVKVRDRITFEFNFIEPGCYIYHNDDRIDHADAIKLKTTHIIPFVALSCMGQTVEITKYEFINN